MIPFIRKYVPGNSSEIVGQDEAVKSLKDYISNYAKKKRRAALIHGPSGVGKTAAAYAAAKESQLEVLEVNASDFRSKEKVNSIIGNALKQRSLFSKGKIILIDEVDGLSGDGDRGGVQAIIRLIEDSSFPVICTANNPYHEKLNSLRSKAEMIQFAPLEHSSIFKILKAVCEKEGIAFDENSLKQLSRMAGGDARAAINDLQAVTEREKQLTGKSLKSLSERNRTETMISALLKIFKTTSADIALAAFDNVEEDFDRQFLWIDENLPKEYEKPEELAKAYDSISKADVYRGRIRRWQHWRFLVYINALLTAGVATAKKEKYRRQVSYKPTGRLLKIWWANQRSMKKKAIAQKIAEKTHCSTRRAMRDCLPYVQQMFKDKEMANALSGDFDLDEEEVAWLGK